MWSASRCWPASAHRLLADRRTRLQSRQPARHTHARLGVLVGSLLSALAATIILRVRNRRYRQLCAEDECDSDHDGVPDVYELTRR